MEFICLIKNKNFDIVVIGGGIIGAATALELLKRFPTFTVAVVEKEACLAAHQSGNNGGVIHAGIYYKPGSLRSKLCIEGLHRLYSYCEENAIPHKRNGKLIVASDKEELAQLKKLYENAIVNNITDAKLIGSNEIKKIEPYCKGLMAIHSPNTGIIKYGDLTRHFGKKFQQLGGTIFFNCEVTGISTVNEGDGTTIHDTSSYPLRITSNINSINTRFLVTCGGLQSDKLAEMTGEKTETQIIPIRGEYFYLRDERKYLVNGSIYQVPNPDLPFHGIHLTSQLDGKIWVGPKSMLAPKREGYNWDEINLKEFWEMYSSRGLQLFVLKNFGPCFYEFMKSVNSTIALRNLQKYIPSLQPDDIVSKASTGIQAHALNTNGELVEEFTFSERKRILHCQNMPSPAATASLAIASHLSDKVQKQLTV